MQKKHLSAGRMMMIARLTAAALLFAAAGCVQPDSGTEKPESLVIASWNVQALFDAKGCGNEYAEFRAESGWTEEKYRSRLNTISGAVQVMAADAETAGGKAAAPDVMALIEIENQDVLADIAGMPGMDYGWTFFAAAPGASLGIGVLSRLPIAQAVTHSVHFGEQRGPRPAVELRLDAGGEDLALFLCHWKSKLGGGEKTEKTRRSEAAVIARRLTELEAEDTPLVIMGDLNENYDDFFREGMAYPCALLPDTSEAGDGFRSLPAARQGGLQPGFQDFLVLSGARPPFVKHLPAATALYSPWMDETLWTDEETAPRGSFYYKERWETIDHVLLNGAVCNGTGWNFAGFRAVRQPPFTNSKGIPAAYIARTGSGLSDHLPVIIRLERAGQNPRGAKILQLKTGDVLIQRLTGAFNEFFSRGDF